MALHRSPHALVPLLLLGLLAASAAPAEILVETYRSPFGTPWSVSVNQADNSVWAATGGSVMHLAEDGIALSQTDGFWAPASTSANPTDGSCWVADSMNGEVVRLAPDGTELWRVAGFNRPYSVSVNPNDGSCWVAAVGVSSDDSSSYLQSAVFRMSEDGALLWAGYDFSGPLAVSVNSTDGSCWVANTSGGQVVHLARNGTELWRGGGFLSPYSVSADPRDGSCWVADIGDWDDDLFRYVGSAVVHLGADGTELWRTTRLSAPTGVAVNPNDGSCWVSESESRRTVHLSKEGLNLGWVEEMWGDLAVSTADDSCWVASAWFREMVHISEYCGVLWRGAGPFAEPSSISTNPTDGSCWVSNLWPHQVSHVAEDGTELWRSASALYAACAVSVNPTDGSCWMADRCHSRVVHLAGDGTELWRGVDFEGPTGLSVNPADGSCWVADTWSWSSPVLHLAPDGSTLWTGESFNLPYSVSVNSADGSCWVADSMNGAVVHLAPDGAELWRSGSPLRCCPYSVSVNPTDGSCWVAASHSDEVVHFAADGTELWQGFDFYMPVSVSVNPTDGSCWVADSHNDRVVHLAASGAQLSWVGGFDGPTSVSVNPTDGSCWVADIGNGQIVRLVPWFDDVPASAWCFDAVFACVDAGIVSGYDDGLYHPDYAVARDQMAAYISRSIATPTGEGSLADYIPPTTPSFPDVGTDHWAYAYIEYAVAANIVGGYEDGSYHPEYVLDRGQMAVFIARALVTPTGDAGIPDPVGDPTFPDVTPDSDSAWCYKHVEYIACEGACGGYGDGLYHPEYACSRDQMAVYIARAFDLVP